MGKAIDGLVLDEHIVPLAFGAFSKMLKNGKKNFAGNEKGKNSGDRYDEKTAVGMNGGNDKR